MSQREGGIPYLDCEAQSLVATESSPIQDVSLTVCGRWAAVGYCEEGHAVARTILCRREWCQRCGERDSDAHKRRWTSWLPKAQQCESLGQLTVTFPVEIRNQLRTQDALRAMQSLITGVLRDEGFHRGLRRWHYMGDESTVWNPHLNFLLDSGRLSKPQLARLKSKIRTIVGVSNVIHYQYSNVPANKLHMVKYITRPTFTKIGWDYMMAVELHGFRNTWAWGVWKDAPLWSVDSPADTSTAAVTAIKKGICPACAGPLAWSKHCAPATDLSSLIASDEGERYFLLDPSAVHRWRTRYPTVPWLWPRRLIDG